MSEAARPVPVKDGGANVKTFPAKAHAAFSERAPLGPLTVPRRSPRPQDVQIEILYCGVCHSDLHQVRNEWKDVMATAYPCVPGHEIVGRVVKVGSTVKKFKEGDIAAVGCMVDSCRVCESCRSGLEQYCEHGFTLTYNFPDKILGGVTYCGYSESIALDEAFVLRVPKGLDPAGTTPLLCAGITTCSPMPTRVLLALRDYFGSIEVCNEPANPIYVDPGRPVQHEFARPSNFGTCSFSARGHYVRQRK
jgi:alcohol dehydrogenase (NADP+)